LRSLLAKPLEKRIRTGEPALGRDEASRVRQTAGVPAGLPRFLRNAIQAKLTVNQPGDPYEQQADRISGLAAAGGMRTWPAEGIARTSPPSAAPSTPIAMSSSGSSLNPHVRERAEWALGADLGQVRVHDSPADRGLARSLGAKSFTHGSHIWLGPDQSSADVSLMAHETAHVVQQGAAPGTTPAIQRSEEVTGPHAQGPEAQAANAVFAAPGEQPLLSAPGPAPSGPAPLPAPETCPPPFDMLCAQATTSPGAVVTNVVFPQDSAALTSRQRADIDAAAASWHAAGGSVSVRVDGYASAEGPCTYNWNLSCRRAQAVVAELISPSDGSPGVPAGSIEFFAHGETNEFAKSLGPNRLATISVPVAPPPPAPPPPACVLPVTLGIGRTGCGSGTDFTHFDFPSISLSSELKLAAWARAHPAGNFSRGSVSDLECEVEMDGVLRGLAGSTGHAAFARFAAGTGGTEVHGSGSTLGSMALASGSFAATLAAVKKSIETQLAAQASTGAFDPCALSVVPPATRFDYSDGLPLKAVIGGTHGEKLFATGFLGSVPLRSYTISLLFIICDNFGVDEADLYAPGLFPFWVLQHERSATLYAPFINELDLAVTASGTF
jgi:outer membrane protein OmpA-like peptidoglycan-associated protein